MGERIKEAISLCERGDFDAANKIFKELADAGNREGMTYLAHSISYGYGFEPNFEKALPYYLKAAELQDRIAQYELGWIYMNGDGPEAEYEVGVKWMTKSAENGFPKAQFEIGRLHHYSAAATEGCEASDDVEKALTWYHRAAEQGDGQAAMRLSELYSDEMFGVKDLGKATEWFRKSVAAMEKVAKPGYRYRGDIITVMDMVCYCYLSGHPLLNILPDYKKAAEWAEAMTRSSDGRDNARGHFILGKLYMNGWGVPKDDEKGKACLKTAAGLGDIEAEQLLGNPNMSDREALQQMAKKVQKNFRGIKEG